MGTPTNPDPGDMHIDATGITVLQVAADDTRKLIKIREGADKAMDNVLLLTPEQIAQAGLNTNDVAHLCARIAEYRNVTRFLEAAERMSSRLDQTAQRLGDEIGVLFGEIAAQARKRAQHSPDRGAILDGVKDLLEYQSAPAKKAVATREKKKNGQGKPEEQPAPPAPPAT